MWRRFPLPAVLGAGCSGAGCSGARVIGAWVLIPQSEFTFVGVLADLGRGLWSDGVPIIVAEAANLKVLGDGCK